MKIGSFLKIFIILLLIGCSGKSDKPQTPEEFAKSIIETFIQNDKKEFIGIALPSQNTFLKFVKETVPEKLQESAIKSVKETYNNNLSNILNSWDAIYEKASTENFKWSDISYIDAKYKIKKTRYNVERTDIYVIFGTKESNYIIKLDDCIRFYGKWLLSDTMRWKGKNK